MVRAETNGQIDLSEMPDCVPAACGVIIGATKCGTTSLYRALSSHPNICPSRRKELNLFLEAETSPESFEAYLEHFRYNPLVHRVTLEASPQYTHFPRFEGVAKRMKAAGVPFKLIYVVRDPFERLESHYRNGLGEGFLEAGPSEWLDEYGVVASDYSAQLAIFEGQFTRNDILVISFDMVTSDPMQAHDLICRHLGVPAGKYLPQRWENRGEAFIEERARQLVEADKSGAEKDVANARQESLIPPTVRRKLRDRWMPGMTPLCEAYGIDVTRWGFLPDRTAPADMAATDRVQAAGMRPSAGEILEIDCPQNWRPGPSPDMKPGLKKPWFEARQDWASGDLVSGRQYGRRAERIPLTKFSLVIATHKRTDLLFSLLKALRVIVRNRMMATEVFVVIDGDPADRYADLARQFADVASFVRLTENRGPGTARNVGAAMASGDYLLFLDDDCLPGEFHLERLSDRLRTYPNIVAMGGPTMGLPDQTRDFYERFTLTAGLNPKPGYHDGHLICLPSCNLAVRRDWFLTEHGFDPDLRASEDFNLTFRLKASGALLYDDHVWSVPHDQNWGLKGVLKRAKRDGYWLSAHAASANDGVARSILPGSSLSALWKDIPRSLTWRNRSWAHIKPWDRRKFVLMEAVRQIWIWRGCRKWESERRRQPEAKSAEPQFVPDNF